MCFWSKWIYRVTLGWPKSPFSFSPKIKDTFFHFHQLYWFGYCECIGYLPLLASSVWRPEGPLNIFQCIRQPHSWELFVRNVNSTKKLRKSLLALLVSYSTFSVQYTKSVCVCVCVFQLHFYLSWNNKKHKYAKNIA